MAKKETRQCWVDEKVSCKCDSDTDCIEMIKQYAKVVYCNDFDCLYNKALPYEHELYRGRNYTPCEGDKMKGICGRPELAMRPIRVSDGKVTQKRPTCSVRSDKALGHLDFSRFVGKGMSNISGNISEI